MIRTKLHILASNIDPETHVVGKDHPMVKDMQAAASYVVDNEVLDLLRREDASKSIKALVEANLVRLPYNPMLVEFEVSPALHEFVLLREHDGKIKGKVVIMSNKNHVAMVMDKEIEMEVKGDGFLLTRYPPKDKKGATECIASFMTGVHIALLMLNTKGIEKEVVHVAEGLNRKRVAHGKPRIQHHSIVHIGTIYRRDGTAIKRDSPGGWHMPMHWRCGHTRRQHFGKNREEEKIVYIPPCIVNFKPEEGTPEAPHRKIKV